MISVCFTYPFQHSPTASFVKRSFPKIPNGFWKVLHSAELHKRENPIVFTELRRKIDKSVTFDETKGGIRALTLNESFKALEFFINGAEHSLEFFPK